MMYTSGGSCVQNADHGSTSSMKAFLLTLILVMMLSLIFLNCTSFVPETPEGCFVAKSQENKARRFEFETQILAKRRHSSN